MTATSQLLPDDVLQGPKIRNTILSTKGTRQLPAPTRTPANSFISAPARSDQPPEHDGFLPSLVWRTHSHTTCPSAFAQPTAGGSYKEIPIAVKRLHVQQ